VNFLKFQIYLIKRVRTLNDSAQGPHCRMPKPRPHPEARTKPPIYTVNVGGKAPFSRSNPEFRCPAMWAQHSISIGLSWSADNGPMKMALPFNSQLETVQKTLLSLRIPRNPVRKTSYFILQYQWGMSVQNSHEPQRVGAQDSRNVAMSLLYTQTYRIPNWNPARS
jgi:hypothetical protein